MSQEVILQIALAIATGGAIYGGIRADLKAMHENIKSAQRAADAAHVRLDHHIDKA